MQLIWRHYECNYQFEKLLLLSLSCLLPLPASAMQNIVKSISCSALDGKSGENGLDGLPDSNCKMEGTAVKALYILIMARVEMGGNGAANNASGGNGGNGGNGATNGGSGGNGGNG